MPKQLKAALAAAVLLVLFMSAQSTVALWQAEETIDAGIVTTGNLSLMTGNGITDEQHYEFTELNGDNLIPGQFVQAPLTVTNNGTTDLFYNLTGATALPTSPTPADTALASASILTIKAGLSAEQCTAGNELVNPLYRGLADAGATLADVRALTAASEEASSEVLCVRLEIAANAPQSAVGGNLQLALNFTGQQR